MYNRYIPQPDGTYRKNTVRQSPPPPPAPDPTPTSAPPPPPCSEEPKAPPPPKPQPAPQHRQDSAGNFLTQLLPKNLDTGDLLIIILLLLMAADCREDKNTALLTLALYLIM